MSVGLEQYLGRLLGNRYRLRALIGTGATAVVCVADDERLGRSVAVKVLHPGLSGDPRFRNRFRAEAQASAQLSHPHVVAVYDWSDLVTTDSGVEPAYLVTELLTGGSLRGALDQAPLSVSQALLVGLHAAEGLAYAHERGLVHRDVKPANLLFGADRRLRIADFGIARAVAEATWTEPEGALVGTARYAAPEQAANSAIDGRADVYALAMTLVEAVTGEVPLVAPSVLATMLARQETDVPIPETMGPLTAVLTEAGRARPEDRMTASQLAHALMEVAGELPRPEPLDLPGIEERALVSGAGEVAVLGGDLDDETLRGESTERGDATGVLVLTDPDPGIELGSTGEHPSAVGDDEGGSAGLPFVGEPDGPGDPDEVVPGMGRGRRAAVAALIGLALLVMFGAWSRIGGGFGESEPEVVLGTVGEYVGRSFDDVSADVELAGWTVVTVHSRADGFEPGSIIRQSPASGVKLAPDQEVTLVVSDGYELRTVPELEGLPLADALDRLAEAGFFIGETAEEYSETAPIRQVLTASLVAGSEAETGTRVDLTWSRGPAPRTIPPIGGAGEDLIAALEAEGLVVAVEEDYSRSVPEGEVISAQPGAGTVVARGSTVTLTVSLGLPFVTVPDVRGDDAADAAGVLDAAGLRVIDTEGPPNAEVLATSPPAGESVREGTEVVIFTRR